MKNALTIDVEDYFQVENFRGIIPYSDWDKFELRAENNTDKLLNILKNHNVRATFFVVGWIAERCPGLVKRIHASGHEIACHSYGHMLIYKQQPEEFRQDIRKAKKILEDIISDKVIGYRAPSYSITKNSLWAFDILCEEGFKYDSSLFPIHHDKGGLASAKRLPHYIECKNGVKLWEFPISTIQLFGQNIPFSGGGYLRFLPYNFVKWAGNQLINQGIPLNIYIHPWEFDPQQPKINAGMLNNFRHYINIDKNEQKLKRLLNDFEFVPIKDLYA